MKINSPSLFIEINNLEYIFAVGDENEQNNFNLIYKCIVPIQGIENFKITDFDLVFNDIKKNIYFIEQKLNYAFKNLILILNNFNYSFIMVHSAYNYCPPSVLHSVSHLSLRSPS